MERKCEFTNCQESAVWYGGYRNANDWAGYACDEHAVRNFAWKERVKA